METVRFVGRTAILGEVAEAVAAARARRGGLVLLTGEAGAGKTWAAQEAARRTDACRVFWGWCQPEGGGAYQPWARVLREIAEADEHTGRLVAASEPLRALISGSSVGGGDQGRAGDSSAATLDHETARLQLTGDVARMLREASARSPLLLAFDDVHDADASSLRLLRDLAPGLRSAAVLVLATARPGPAATALARLGRALPVGPLTAEDVAALAAAGGREADGPRVAALLERTGGDAFFVAEALRHGDRAGRADPDRVPASVRDAIHDRTAELSEPCRRLLAVASTLGTRFRLDVLAEASGVTLADVAGLLAEAARAGLTLASDEPGTGRFRHDLMREAVHDALPAGERAGLHARVASVLGRFLDRGRDVEPAEVAEHLLRAGPDEADAAAARAWQAADRAMGLLAFDDAVRWYEAAARAGSPTAEQRARLDVATGSARLGQGDRATARKDFLRGATAAREAGDTQLLAEAALGLGAGPAGFEVGLLDREQIDLLEEARAGLLERVGTAGRGDAVPRWTRSLLTLVTARLSVATTLIEPAERRTDLAREAVAAARDADDPGALAYALSALCDARSGPDHRADRLRWSAEIVEQARRVRDVPLELLGRRLRLVALWEAGAIDEADAETLAYEAAAKLLNQPLYLFYVPLWRGMRALLQGRHEDCLAALAETEEMGRAASSGNAEMLALTQRWCLVVGSGDRDGLRQWLRDIPPLDRMPGVWPQVSLALVAAQVGDVERARRQLTAVAPRLAAAPRDSEWLPMLAQIAEAVALSGPHPIAGQVYALLEPYAELFAVEGIGAVLRGPVHRFLAQLAAASGDKEAAARHLARTRELAEAAGAPSWAEALAGAPVGVAAGAPTGALAGADGAPSPAVGATPAGDAASGTLMNAFRRDGQGWVLRYHGHEARLPDSKGLRDLAVLLARPGTPVPALDLASASAVGSTSMSVADSELDLHRPGDLGEAVDAPARAAYRRRLEELRTEAEEADIYGDEERSARIAVERDALVAQLSAAYGLGGRPRRTGSPAERARSTVTARIRAALDRISQEHPGLGRHLRASVHTGTLCVYEPETDQRWDL